MVSILFWNLKNKPLYKVLATACREHDVDILILAEADLDSDVLREELNDGSTRLYYEVGLSKVIRFFTRYLPANFAPIYDSGRVVMRLVTPPIGPQVLLVAAHLPSKLHREEPDQQFYVQRITKKVNELEAKLKCKATIVVGDLNLNPFDAAMTRSDMFHGVMDQAIARAGSRMVQGEESQYFYNPMWSRLGDGSVGPPGTYYHRTGNVQNLFWHTFDQVLLRPSLLEFFSHNDLLVLTKIGSAELLRNNKPNKKFSDHLPIVVRLNLERAVANVG